ncbi:unnamed protein product [Closterium sp. Naga37s-1]|nr:unnamed protein product [Closterium sp. Naga37s-1]
MALIPSPQHRNYRNLSVLPALLVHPLPVGSPHIPRPRFFLGPLRSRSLAYQELMLPVLPIAPSSPHGASLSRSTYNGPLSSSCIHFTIYNPPRFSYSSCTMAAQIYNPDHTMSAAEEEALGASRDDLAVDDLPEGMFHHLADPADLPAAKKSCMVPDASPAPNPSPATSSGSVPALPAHSPVPLTIAALSAPSFGLAPSLVATAASPNSPVTRATTYASVASGSNLAPALPASLFASPTPGGAPRNLRRARTDAAVPLPFRMCRRMVVNVLLPKAGLESQRSEIFAGINAQVCGFMFSSGIIPSFEQTIGDPYRVARRVYGRLLFSWPSQDDAAAFRKLFPLTLKVSNSHPFLLKVFEDTLEAFTAAKAAGLPIATLDDPNFERIPSEIPLEDNKPPMLLNVSCHVCSLCANNHRTSDHEAFAARRRQRLTNRNVISVAQLQKANGTLLDNLSQLCYPTFSLPYRSGPRVLPFPLSISTSPPPYYTTSPLFQSYISHPPCSVPLLPHPPLPSQLCYLTFSLPYRSGPPVLPFRLSISTSPPTCYNTSPLFQSYSSHPPCSVPLLPHPPLPSQLLGRHDHLSPPPPFTLSLPPHRPAVNALPWNSPPAAPLLTPLCPMSHPLLPPQRPSPWGSPPLLSPELWPTSPHCIHLTLLLSPHSRPSLPTAPPPGNPPLPAPSPPD